MVILQCLPTNNLRVEADHVYVIPPKTSLRLAHGVLKLQSRTSSRTIDPFLESLAQDQRGRAIGVLLSGLATDGTLGLKAIKAEGGITFAQDESAEYGSMASNAIRAGWVDFVLSPDGIAKELTRLAKHPYAPGGLTTSSNRLKKSRRAIRAALDGANPFIGYQSTLFILSRAKVFGENAARFGAASRGLPLEECPRLRSPQLPPPGRASYSKILGSTPLLQTSNQQASTLRKAVEYPVCALLS